MADGDEMDFVSDFPSTGEVEDGERVRVYIGMTDFEPPVEACEVVGRLLSDKAAIVIFS